MKTVVCFGEIMARHAPAGHLRLAQVLPGSLEVTFAGAEANTAVAIAQLGGRAQFVTALPDSPLGDACAAALRATNVDMDHVTRLEKSRLGLFFVETGANQRGGQVLYDREGSAFAVSGAGSYDWDTMFRDAGWFHTSGISASVSRAAAEATLAAMKTAKQSGLTVSFDLNFRRKLWQWSPVLPALELARQTHDQLLPWVDVLIGNPFDLASLLDDPPPPERLDPVLAMPDDFSVLARRLAGAWPHLGKIAITLRRNHSAHHNGWGALLYLPGEDRCLMAPTDAGGVYQPYEIHAIVDRVGTGDVFSGALIFALQGGGELGEAATALRFAVAASCLAHSVKGDFFFCRRAEVEALMNGDASGHVSR